MATQDPTGTYSAHRYSGRLPDITLTPPPAFIRAGQPTPLGCAFALTGIAQAETGAGFPPEISDIQILGVTAAKEGISKHPELAFAATIRKTGRRIMAKGVTRMSLAMEIVLCNDQGRWQEELAQRFERSRPEERQIIFTDVRYTVARNGSDLPDDPFEAAARRLSNNAVRNAATHDEVITGVRERAVAYATQDLGTTRSSEVKRLIARAEEQAATRRPGKRDRSGEAPRRAPVRAKSRTSTCNRWA